MEGRPVHIKGNKMIILGELGPATKRQISHFLNEWWEFDNVSYQQYHKRFNTVGEDMITGLKYHDPLIYEFVLLKLEGFNE